MKTVRWLLFALLLGGSGCLDEAHPERGNWLLLIGCVIVVWMMVWRKSDER